MLKKKEKNDVDAMITLAKRSRFYLGELDTRALERSGLSTRACALLDYMNGKITKEPLIAQIETSMRTIKRQNAERKSYMTYIMKMREERAEAAAEAYDKGKDKGKNEERDLMFRIYDMLREHLPYPDIARATQTSVEDVRQIAERFGIAY